MSLEFSEILKQLRTEKRISQKKLAELLYIDRSTVASWETGRRTPDTVMLTKIAACLDTDVRVLIGTAAKASRVPNVMLVDDEKIILTGSRSALEKAMPNATVQCFLKPSAALAYARENHVDLAFVDIEMGSVSGLDLCRTLLEINPSMNVVFLTAHTEYSFPAWNTGACGFLTKPLTAQKIQEQLTHLRFPL